jgi:(2Fe-2S) ferredoxin
VEDCAGGGVVLVVEDMVWYCFVVCEDIREYVSRIKHGGEVGKLLPSLRLL